MSNETPLPLPLPSPTPGTPAAGAAKKVDWWWLVMLVGIVGLAVLVGVSTVNRPPAPLISGPPANHSAGDTPGGDFLPDRVAELGELVELTVIHYNDFHSTFEPREFSRPDGQKQFRGGIAHFVGAIKHFRNRAAQTGERLIVVDAGDFYTGHPLDAFTVQRATREFHNMIRPDAAVLGNHEFDRGDLHHVKLLRGELDAPKPNFPLLCANVTVEDPQWAGNPAWQPHTILTVNKLRIGVIGINTPELFEVTARSAVEHTTLFDPIESLEASLDELAGKTDLNIVLSHCGVNFDRSWMPKFRGRVHLVVSGHSHTELREGAEVGGIPMVSAGAYGQLIGEAQLRYDVRERRLIAWRARTHSVWHGDDAIAPPDDEAAQHFENRMHTLRPMLSRQIATVTERMPNTGRPEQTLGKWMAQAMLDAVPDADLAIMNPSGVRRSFEPGPLTVGIVHEASPFLNNLVKLRLTGRDLLVGTERCLGERPFQFANVTVEYCPLLGPGRQVVRMFVGGEPLDLKREYTVVTNNYVGSQIYKHFARWEPVPTDSLALIDYEVLVAYAEKTRELAPHRLGPPIYQLVGPPTDATLNRGSAGVVLGRFFVGDVLAGDRLTVQGVAAELALAGVECEGPIHAPRNAEESQLRAEMEANFDTYAARLRGGFPKPGRFATPTGEAARRFVAAKLREVVFVRLEVDDAGFPIDSHGRFSVYVFYANAAGADGGSGEWKHLNVELVRAGLAAVCPRHGRSRFADELMAAQAEAQREQAGIWTPETPPRTHYPDYAERMAWWERNASALDIYEARRQADASAVPLMLDRGRDVIKLRERVGQTVEIIGFARAVDEAQHAVSLDHTADTPFAIRFADAAQMASMWQPNFIGEYLHVSGEIEKTETGWQIRPTAVTRYE